MDVGIAKRVLLGPSNRLDSIETVVEMTDSKPLVISPVDCISNVLVEELPETALLIGGAVSADEELRSIEVNVPGNVSVSTLDPMLLEASND